MWGAPRRGLLVEALRKRERPPPRNVGEPGERTHGWQSWATSVSDTFCREALLSDRTAARQTHLRSLPGRNAGAALACVPTAPEFTIAPHLFRVLVLERLQLPFPISEAVCEGCGARVDTHGHHKAACKKTVRVNKRAIPTEPVSARVFQEAGARVGFNAFLPDINVGVPATDTRRIGVLAQDLPCFMGAQLAVDITLRNALTNNCAGQPPSGEQPRVGTILALQTRGRHRNRRALARRSGGSRETTRLCAGA